MLLLLLDSCKSRNYNNSVKQGATKEQNNTTNNKT